MLSLRQKTLQVVEDCRFVLFDEFGGELGKDLQEREVTRSLLAWEDIECKFNTAHVQISNGITRTSCVKTKRQCKATGQFLQNSLDLIINYSQLNEIKKILLNQVKNIS